MIDFEYHAPTSLVQVFELLDRYGDDARIMSGGTALVIQMKQRLSQPGHVVGLRGVTSLNSIEFTPARLALFAPNGRWRTVSPLLKDCHCWLTRSAK